MNCEPSIPSCHSGHNSASEGNTEILELLVLAVGTQLPEVLAESWRRAESNVGAQPRSRWLAELLRYAEWVNFEFSQRISEEYSSHQPELMLTPHSDFFTIGLRLAEEASRDPFLESPVEFR